MRRPFSDRWFLAIASLLLLSITGAGVALWRRSKVVPKPPAPVAQKAPAPAEPSAPAELSFTGNIQAQVIVPVPAPIDGTVESVAVEVGHDVFEGQLLARIKNDGLESAQAEAQQEVERSQTRINNLESSLISARLEASRATADQDRARAEFERAERAANREQMLFREGATARLKFEKAQKDFEKAKTDYDSIRELARTAQERITATAQELEAARRVLDERKTGLEGAKADLQMAEVHSPVDGVVSGVRANAGEQVDISIKDLFQIAVDSSKLEILLDAPPDVLAKLREGLPALVQVLEVSQDGFSGEVKKNGQGQFKVEFASPDPNVKPGLSAIVKVKLP